MQRASDPQRDPCLDVETLAAYVATELLLAKSPWDSRGDRTRDLALARSAKADLAAAKAGDTLDQDRKAAAAWLATHE
jgi:hypothetical protein